MRLSRVTAACLAATLATAARAAVATIEFGPMPGDSLRGAITDAVRAKAPADTLVIRLTAPAYEFFQHTAEPRELYISNHDQTNPKAVGLILENAANVTIDGGGARLLFHGRMLPAAIIGCRGCSLENLSVDFPRPQITQVTIEAVDTAAGTVTYRPDPGAGWELRDSVFTTTGPGWELVPAAGIPFEPRTGRVVYGTGDINVGIRGAWSPAPGLVTAPWRDDRLAPGTIVAMRGYGRPAPGIFLDSDTATTLRSVAVRYAEGMGLLAQNCRDVALDRFQVARRGPDDPRRFTTQADATHFSSCSGLVTCVNSLFEGMMDDAINVHGTYLKVTSRRGRSIRSSYQHPQTYGFAWGAPGDTVRFISAATMDTVGDPMVITAITPADTPAGPGVKEFDITLDGDIPAGADPAAGPVGIENLTRTPRVYFARDTVRHNRARGALFSTPRATVVEDNLFDHTSGAAILLCGDCNGWYETGACRDVTIRRNRFVNALTSRYQFTRAVISICPVIPRPLDAARPFHSGITITGNTFETFGTPLLYALSADSLTFRGNILITNTDYPPLPDASQPVILEHCGPDTDIDIPAPRPHAAP